jgi:hypothetical protein
MSNCNNLNFSSATCTQVSRDFDWSVYTRYEDKDKVVIPLTDYVNTVRIKHKDGTDFLTLIDVLTNSEDGIYTEDPLTGVRYIQLGSAMTSTMVDNYYNYEWEQVDSNGKKTLFMYGKIYSCKGVF